MTPLSRACTNGSAPLVELLLKAGANPNTRHRHRRDAAHDVRGQRQRRRGPAADRARRRRQREGAVAESDALDVGGRRASSRTSSACSSRPAPISRRTRRRDSPRCTSRRARATSRRRAQLLSAGVNINIRSQPDEPAAAATRSVPAPDAACQARRRRRVRREVPAIRRRSPRAARRCSWRRCAGMCRSRCSCSSTARIPMSLDAGFTPLHWASATWEGGISNPVYGFSDADERHSRIARRSCSS